MWSRIAVAFAGTFGLVACGGPGGGGDAINRDTAVAESSPGTVPSAGSAVAPMRDASGQDLGTLTLTPGGQGIAVAGRLTGLPPGEHGIHLHAVGRCDAPKFESAGDHWNPTNSQHGTATPKGPHSGDLPNLTVAGDSSVTVQATTPGGMLRDSLGLLDTDGAAVIVHAKPDDNRTQPSGGSGDRIACGVVTTSSQ